MGLSKKSVEIDFLEPLLIFIPKNEHKKIVLYCKMELAEYHTRKDDFL